MRRNWTQRKTDKEGEKSMESLYNLHSWSKQYREEALAQARKRNLVDRARVGRQRRSGRSRVGLAWVSVLSVVHRALL